MNFDPNGGNGKADSQSLGQRPKVLILGDYSRDLFVYDLRPPKHKAPGPAWTPPLSQHVWQLGQGLEKKTCVGLAAAVHAMLEEENKYSVDGNTLEKLPKSPGGCVFVLHRRSNQPDKKCERSRKYLKVQPCDTVGTLVARALALAAGATERANSTLGRAVRF